jgi:hypothetical protein
MKLSNHLSELILRIKKGIERFITPFIFSILIFLLSSYTIITEKADKIILRLLLTFAFGILVSILFTLIKELFEFKIKKLFIDISVIIPAVLCFLSIKDFENNHYVQMGYIGIIACVFCIIVYFCCRLNDKALVIPHLVKSIIFSGFVCAIIQAGLSISLWAINSLIFEITDVYKYFAIISVFIWEILFINLFLSHIPTRDTEIRIPKIFKILALYSALPVYLLLIFILYLYLGKIAITLKMPVGQINWFASFASLFFVFFLFTIRQYIEENKLARLFINFSGYIIIPIIFVQALAIYERLNAYGLTTLRYVSLVFNFIALLFAIFAVIKKGKHLEKIFLAAGAIALLVTLTPINVLDIPNINQEIRLKKILIANNMYDNGKIIPNEAIDKETKVKITSSYEYVKNNEGKKSSLITQYKDTDFKKVFGFSQEYENMYTENAKNKYGNFNYNYDYIDTTGYTKLYQSNEGKEKFEKNILIFNIGEEKIEYDFSKEIERLYKENGLNSSNIKMIYEISNKYKLQIKNISFNVNENDKIEIQWIDAVILER